MKAKNFVFLLFLFLFGIGISFGQNETTSNEDVEFTSEPIVFSNGVTLNILDGYVATNEYNSDYLANKLGIASQDEGDIVAVMVPENLNMVPDQPYLVVLYYSGLVISEKQIAKFNPDSLFFELVLNKNANTSVNWIFTKWINDDVKYDAESHQLRLNCAYKSKYNIDVKQRQIAYWQFGNKGMYHYVWVCPEDKIAIYPPPMDELNQLLDINKGFAYENSVPDVEVSEQLTLTELVGYEDLGSNFLKTYGKNPLDEKNEDAKEEENSQPPVISANPLIMLIGNFGFYTTFLIFLVPVLIIVGILLYNNSFFKPKEKEVPWE